MEFDFDGAGLRSLWSLCCFFVTRVRFFQVRTPANMHETQCSSYKQSSNSAHELLSTQATQHSSNSAIKQLIRRVHFQLACWTNTFGPLKLPPSLSPSLRHKSSHTSRHYFFLIFCNKLACSKCRKVTKPDFRRKLLNFFYKQFFKK